MEEDQRSTLLPLLLVVAVVAAVGLALYFTMVPSDDGDGTEPDAPTPVDEPDRDVIRPPVVPDTNRKDPNLPAPLGGIVNGRVVDARGDPVADASVLLYPGLAPKPEIGLVGDDAKQRQFVSDLYQYFPEDGKSLYPLGRRPEAVAKKDRPIAEIRTRENGEFRFKQPVSGHHRITARKDRLFAGERVVQPGRPVTITVTESSDLFGVVRFRGDSRPVADASIRIRAAGTEVAAKTAENGSFRIEGLPPGFIRIEVSHPLYASDILPRVKLDPGREKEVLVELTNGHTLTVLVKDIDDDTSDEEPPVPGATVTALRIADEGYVVGTADEQGKVVFEGLPPGDYFVNGVAKDYFPLGEEKVTVREDTTYEVYLEQAVYSTLIVVDENGVAIPGAAIWTSDPDEEFHEGISRMVGSSDAQGRFRFAFEFDGMRSVVYVLKKGYAVAVVTPDDSSEPENIRVELREARTLRGRVTDVDGQPIAGAKVYLDVMLDDADTEDLTASIYTDKDGKYIYPHLPHGEVWVEVERDGYEGDENDFETSASRREHVMNFVLEQE